jgi:putative ABC transport system permease protein
MLKNYLTAALGNLARNKLYAGVTIAGLAAGFAAAILIGLFVRDELTFERFIPGYERVYRLEGDIAIPGEKIMKMDFTTSTAAAYFRLDFPGIERIARATPFDAFVRKGDVETKESTVWADPDFFMVMPYPVLAGDANAAMAAPDGLAITQSAARKYFGEDAPLGKLLLINVAFPQLQSLPPADVQMMAPYHPMRVLAVLKDLPSNTHLNAQIFAAARASFSLISLDDRYPSPFNSSELTYVRLKPGVSPDHIRAGLVAFANRRYSVNGTPSAFRFRFEALKDLHFSSAGGFQAVRPPGDRTVDFGIAAVGALIVAIAAINFVTLMTARATRRAVEVGVRKAVGASRRDLILQFLGEALIYVLIAMVIAVALAELFLPYVNAYLRRTLRFDYLADPGLPAAIVGAALLTALLAGFYPALVLSSFRPASALKGGASQTPGSVSVRQVLVVAQFAILISLIVMTATIYRQTSFALNGALRLNSDQVITISSSCDAALRDELGRLRGVKSAACASWSVLGIGSSKVVVTHPDKSYESVGVAPVDIGFLELQGLTPLAGRFQSRSYGEDVVLERPGAGPDQQPTIVVNESAVAHLGFKSPQDALGKTITWARWSAGKMGGSLPPARPSRIVGVVHDFTLGSIRNQISPTIYYDDPSAYRSVVVKLTGQDIPETLKAVTDLWKRTGHILPPEIQFENQAVQDLYRDVLTQGVAISVCSGLAILIACLGLFALAAFTTERRTKEIGVRKAMGASTMDVVRLLIWQFTRPVLWANLIAWPLAWWAMNTWLHGFAYRVDLPPWLFAAASVAAVLIAWATVSTHAWLVARAKPVTALRYE